MRELESLAEDDAQPMYIGMFVWLVPTCVCVCVHVCEENSFFMPIARGVAAQVKKDRSESLICCAVWL